MLTLELVHRLFLDNPKPGIVAVVVIGRGALSHGIAS